MVIDFTSISVSVPSSEACSKRPPDTFGWPKSVDKDVTRSLCGYHVPTIDLEHPSLIGFNTSLDVWELVSYSNDDGFRDKSP